MQLHLRGTGIACSMCMNPTQSFPWHGGCHTSVPSVPACPGWVVQPGSALSWVPCLGAAVLAVPMTSLTVHSPDGPRSRLAAKRGLTINFYWRSAVCTVHVPRPALRSGPEEVPFDTPKAKQMTAPSQAGSCTPAHLGGRVAICCATSPVARST